MSTEPKTPTGAPVDDRFSHLPPERRIQTLEGDDKKLEDAAAQRPKSASPPTEQAPHTPRAQTHEDESSKKRR